MKPLVSIVMPSFNQAAFIERALSSVLTQSWQNIEIIVQDGGSTDDTHALLEKIALKDSRLRWSSAVDSGPAEAINLALKRVRGTYIGWLNSDDEYAPEAIERAVLAMQKNPDWVLCYGLGEHIDEFGQFIEKYPTLPQSGDQVPTSEAFQNGCFICQPTVFFKAIVPKLIGNLDLSLKASFDFDYWLRVFNAFPSRIGYLPQVQAYSRLHAATITHNQRRQVAIEGMKVLARHQKYASGDWVVSYLNEQRQVGLSGQQLKEEAVNLLNEVKPYMQLDEWNAFSRRFL